MKFLIRARYGDRVASLKKQICRIYDANSDTIRLFFGGSPLLDTYAIAKYNIKQYDVIHLVLPFYANGLALGKKEKRTYIATLLVVLITFLSSNPKYRQNYWQVILIILLMPELFHYLLLPSKQLSIILSLLNKIIERMAAIQAHTVRHDTELTKLDSMGTWILYQGICGEMV